MVKKIFCMLIVMVLIMFMVISVAYAADSPPGTPNEFISWEFLGTMGGAVAATTIIVQFLKVPIDKVGKIPTRIIVYGIALIILLFAEYITQGGITLARTSLIVVNAVLVAIAAMGAYEATFKYLEKPS